MVHVTVRPSDWTFSIDLKDKYLHVPIHPGSFKYLRLALSPTNVYHFRALPFRLNTAPLVFTQIVEFIATHIRQSHCLYVHVYLDDWLFQHQNRKILLESAREIVVFLQSLGWEVNLEKSYLTPSQSFDHSASAFAQISR